MEGEEGKGREGRRRGKTDEGICGRGRGVQCMTLQEHNRNALATRRTQQHKQPAPSIHRSHAQQQHT